MKQDNTGRNFLYVAQKEAGLTIYDISNLSAPSLVKNIPIGQLDSLHVMNLSQNGNYLYLALGNSFNSGQNPGMAIIDITTPPSASVSGVWKSAFTLGGAGIVKVENNIAYLGADYHGLILLDVTIPNNITYLSRYLPNRNYPTVVNPQSDTVKYNARGMEVSNGIVYLCYDRGGFRIINCTNKFSPVETGKYCNPVLNNLPRAYNNVIIDDTLAYIAVDYCGMEVLNISDTSNITLHGWWNPWHCQSNPFNWLSSNGHTNEIEYNKSCHLIFMSSGKSDMRVVDVSNPSLPDSCNFYGNITDTLGTWGMSMYQDHIFLSYICTYGVPFASNWTGVKILTYSPCNTGIPEQNNTMISIYPVPANEQLIIETQAQFTEAAKLNISVTNSLGQICASPYNIESPNKIRIVTAGLKDGIYFLRLSYNNTFSMKKFAVSSDG